MVRINGISVPMSPPQETLQDIVEDDELRYPHRRLEEYQQAGREWKKASKRHKSGPRAARAYLETHPLLPSSLDKTIEDEEEQHG